MDVYMGTVMLFSFNYPPQDGCSWVACEGQLLPINQNQALYAILGIKYGGDGKTNFALPNLKGAEPDPNMRYFIATTGLFPMRQ